MTCTPQELLDSAHCLTCLPLGQLDGAQLAAICTWANNSTGSQFAILTELGEDLLTEAGDTLEYT